MWEVAHFYESVGPSKGLNPRQIITPVLGGAMPLYDYKCKECGKMIELLENYKSDTVLWPCHRDGNSASTLCTHIRQFPAAKTTFKFADRSGLKR